MDEARRRTLYGRRRGKKLRAGQQSLLDTLLPPLSLAAAARAAEDRPRARPVRRHAAGRRRLARGRLRRGRASGLAGRAASRRRADRLRALSQRRRQVPGAYRARRASSNVRLFTDDARLVMAALPDAVAVARLRAVPRSVAQDAPSQAALRAARHARRAGAADEARRGAAARDRRSELPALDGRACLHPSGLRMAGRTSGRLARPAGRLAADALRAEDAGRPQAGLPAAGRRR